MLWRWAAKPTAVVDSGTGDEAKSGENGGEEEEEEEDDDDEGEGDVEGDVGPRRDSSDAPIGARGRRERSAAGGGSPPPLFPATRG